MMNVILEGFYYFINWRELFPTFEGVRDFLYIQGVSEVMVKYLRMKTTH
jgi:hypothetical protein